MFKKFILGSLLVASLTACPYVDPGPEPVVSPIAKDDATTTNPSSVATIKPADNDIKGSAELVFASIDLNPNTSVQDDKFSDSTGKGTFQLNKSTGEVKFQPITGKTGEAKTSYTIKDTNGNVSSVASIKVTIGTTVIAGPQKVLFIGNSRTWYEPCSFLNGPFSAYNISSMLQNMAVNESRPLQVTAVTDCGQSLSGHFSNTVPPTEARVQIATKGWDYVVLQASTPETENASQSGTISLLQRYKSEILAASPNAKIVLSENWSLQGYPVDQLRLTTFYQQAADSLGAKIAPIGRAWRAGSFTEDQMFVNDTELKHATTLGAYIAASTYYSLFYGKQAPNATGVPNTLVSTDANTARTNAYNAYLSPSMSKYR